MNTQVSSSTHSTTEEGHLIYHKDENLFAAQTQVIVIPVNIQGVMGQALAARYPGLLQQYQQECQSHRLRIGRPTLFTKSTPWILLFPMKDFAASPPKLEYIEQTLSYLVANYQKGNITSIAFPKIGCGEGQLSWEAVGPILARALLKMEIPIHIYINQGDAQYQPTTSVSPYQIADTLPTGEKTIELIEGTARMMLFRDKRFNPSIYYICVDGQVHAVTVQEEWARLLSEKYQNDYSA